jgi:Ran GTPase-activating protein (RanGAP) involved in mRNA processing and transport
LQLEGFLDPEALEMLQSGVTKNTTLRELTLKSWSGTSLTAILTSLRDHPLLQKLSLVDCVEERIGLDILLHNGKSKITDLTFDKTRAGFVEDPADFGGVLQTLGRNTTLTKLSFISCRLYGHDQASHLEMVLRRNQGLQNLDLRFCSIGGERFAQIASALDSHPSMKTLSLVRSQLHGMESVLLLRDIIRHNKILTKLDLSSNSFSETPGAVQCIAEGLSINTTLLDIDFTECPLGDQGVSSLAQGLSSRNSRPQKLTLTNNGITSAGVRTFINAMMEYDSRITELGLCADHGVGNEAASFLAGALGRNALPHLTRLLLCNSGIGDDEMVDLVSALEQNETLTELDLRDCDNFGERGFTALANSLPKIKTLQRIVLKWCAGLASAMPLLLEGLRENTSLVQAIISGYTSESFPPVYASTCRYVGGRMQEMQFLGYRNRVLPLVRAPVETAPPLGLWSHGLAKVATLPDVLFYVLRAKPKLVPSADTDDDTSKKRKRGDNE